VATHPAQLMPEMESRCVFDSVGIAAVMAEFERVVAGQLASTSAG
jgi:hypothetical protein